MPYIEQPQSIQVERLEAGIDWLTMTVSDDKARKTLYTRWSKTVEMLTGRFNLVPKKWAWHGYVGFGIQGMEWGTRKSDCILRIHGDLAKSFWKLFVRLADNVSRCDLAVTAYTDPPVPNITKLYYDLLGARPRNWTRIENNKTLGNTLYIGSRTSDAYGRVYDKGLESGLSLVPGAIWRYEVEYKGTYARQVVNRLLVETCPRKGPSPLIKRTVYDWFDKRNVPPVFHTRNSAEPIAVKCRIRDDDTYRALEWLRVQVSPTVRRLCARYRGDVVEALGLGDPKDEWLCPSI